MKDFHTWLKDRQAKQYYIPDTSEELMQIYKVEKPSFLMRSQRSRFTKHSKQQMKYAVRVHRT